MSNTFAAKHPGMLFRLLLYILNAQSSAVAGRCGPERLVTFRAYSVYRIEQRTSLWDAWRDSIAGALYGWNLVV